MLRVVVVAGLLAALAVAELVGASVKPSNDLSLDRNGFSVLGMSTNERLPLRWWHWIMESHYNESSFRNHSGGLHSHFFDGSLCPMRFFGILNETMLPGYAIGGLGSIRDVSSAAPKYFARTLPCYYTTSMTTFVGHTAPYTRVALHCPLLPSDLTEAGAELFFSSAKSRDESSKGVEGGHEQCRLLNDAPKEYRIEVYPSDVSPRSVFGSSADEKTSVYPFRDYVASEEVQSLGAFAVHAPWDANSKHGDLPPPARRPMTLQEAMLPPAKRPVVSAAARTPAIICAIQTFKSPVSGPNLYLFAKHHSSLGLTVLIYDRFGAHSEFLAELLTQDQAWRGIIYHPYTVLELLKPSVYNQDYARQEGEGFKYYYARDQAFDVANSTRKVVDDVEVQDLDKMITFDLVRTAYFTKYSIVFLDSDELLAPFATPWPDYSKEESLDGITLTYLPVFDPKTAKAEDIKKLPPVEKTKIRMTMGHFRDLLHAFFTSPQMRETTEELHLVRHVASAITPNRTVHLYDKERDGDVIGMVNNCTIEGHKRRDTAYMVSCWSDSMIQQKWLKYADNSAVCPFHWIHRACWKHAYFPKDTSAITPHFVLNRNPGLPIGCFCGSRTVYMPHRFLILHMSHHQFLEQHKYWKNNHKPVKFQHGVNPLVDMMVRP